MAPIPVVTNAAANALAPTAAAPSATPTATNDLARNALRTVYTFVIPVSSPNPVITSPISVPNSTKDACIH